MWTYRTTPPDEIAISPAPRAPRTLWIAFVAVGAHAAVLTAAFVCRAPPPPVPATRIVTVVTGHVDPWRGEFHAMGVARARVRARD